MLKTAANLQKENGSTKCQSTLFYVKKTFLAQTPKTVQQPIWLLSKFVTSLSILLILSCIYLLIQILSLTLQANIEKDHYDSPDRRRT